MGRRRGIYEMCAFVCVLCVCVCVGQGRLRPCKVVQRIDVKEIRWIFRDCN